MSNSTPDIRIHSLGAAEAYGFRPLTEAGRRFVDGHRAMVRGNWQDGIFWFHERFMPRHALAASPLRIVGGIGDSDAHDVPWPMA